MDTPVKFRHRVSWRLGRAVACVTWPVRAPVKWFLSWRTRNKVALLVFIVVQALMWLAGVDFTERSPVVAFAIGWGLLAAVIARIFPYEDFSS